VALEAVDLPELLEEVARWWRPAAAQKGLELTVTMAPDVPRHIVSDRGRIGQVLNNYLGNAVKFTPAGRIALAVEMHAPEGAAPRIRFRVSDTGPGIAPQDIARLYKPFMQIEGQRREGWGLGLSICASIAQAMGAEVGVESEPGRGSVFRFDLPARVAAAPGPDEAAPDPPPPTAPPAAPRPSGRHILLAEDNALNQQVMRQMLADMGHAVTVAANGFEALEVLERGGIDLVLMDVMMPGLGGVGATRQLRASDWPARDVPVIACSAHVSPDAEARYREIGMTAFLPKPVDRAQLEAAIDAALDAAAEGPARAV
jgi:CheY-like chemotaxis protein/anti-sigma regulatory factor (Ser/Thr protein kinase)